MRCLCILFLSAFFANVKSLEYNKDGDFIIGAILPLTKDSGKGKCTEINPEGVALAESIDFALTRIRTTSKFTSLLSTKSMGYAIRDGCGDPVVQKKVAYEFNAAALAYARNETQKKPVDIVLSSFDVPSISLLHLLNVENILQISYSKDNAKLAQKTAAQKYAVENLISVYPENTNRAQVAVDLIKEFQFQYVFGVFSDDYQGREASKLLKASLGPLDVCDESFVIDDSNIKATVTSIAKNKMIKAVLVHCSKDVEKKLYQELVDRNMTHLIIFSTQDWSASEADLQKYSSAIEGMIFIKEEKDAKNFEGHMKGLLRPYTNHPWVKELYNGQGGDDSCIGARTRDATTEKCFKAEESVSIELAKASGAAVYGFEAIFTIAEGLLKGENLLETVKGLQFEIDYLPRNEIKYNQYLIAEGTSFELRNIQGGKSQSVYVGTWMQYKNQSPLKLLKSSIKWKSGSQETPVSSCSDTCVLGFYREFTDASGKCCWECKKCPENTFSNVTNANQCITCGEGCALKPDQTGFIEYELVQFKWFGPIGSFLIFLIVIACCFILLALGIISQNSDHELIQLSGYNLLCLYLIGCLLLALAPIPLLVTPTIDSCNGFIAVFNIGLTVIFGVMITRSSYINGFYDESTGDVIKGGFGKYPRLVIIVILLIIQGIILIVINNIDPPQTLHTDTDVWYIKYAECSNWASWGFWVAFSFNIALSLIGNFMSCSSTKMEDLCEELKWLLITYLMFYMCGITHIILLYRVKNEQLAVGQAVMCLIMSMCFYFFFIWPKVWYVLFKSKDGRIAREREQVPQDEDHITTAIHSSDPFKHHGVVQMRLKKADDSSSA